MSTPPAGRRTLLVPSIADCVMLIITAVIATVGAHSALNTDGDAGRHIRVGETILERGLFYEDLFSHTMAGHRFVPYEWLSEVLTALAHRAGGLPGLVILTALIVGISWGLLALFLRRSGVDPLLSFIVSISGAAASSFHWLARPHIYSFLGAILLVWLMERGTRKGALWVVLLFMVWANLHGGFLFGLVLIGMYMAGDLLEMLASRDGPAWRERLMRHSMYLGAAIVGATINPSGPALFAHVSGYLGKTYLVDNTNEYMSPDFHIAFGRIFLVVLLGVIAALALTPRRPTYPTLLVVLGTIAFSLHSARNIPLFALTALPLLALHIDPSWRSVSWRPLARIRRTLELGDQQARAGGWAAAATLGAVLLALGHGRVAGVTVVRGEYDPAVFPVEAVRYARAAGLEGRIFNNFIWGGYILYAWPEQRVFIDGQTDFYGEELTREYRAITALTPEWDALLTARGIDLLVVPTFGELARAASAASNWSTLFSDSTATVLRRSSKHNNAVDPAPPHGVAIEQ